MSMSTKDLTALAGELARKDAQTQWGKLNRLNKHLDGLVARSWMPEGADMEYNDLMRKARSPWLRYAAQVIAQGLFVDGFSDSEVWDQVWQVSGMDGKQSSLNEEIACYGYSYLLAFPGDSGIVMRPLSALSTFHYQDDPWEESPDIVVHQVRKDLWRIFDDERMVEVSGKLHRPDDVVEVYHGLGVNPVTPIYSRFPMDGSLPGSLVEVGLPPYKRIVDATFNLQMVQRYAGFPQKYMSGGEIEVDENGNSMIRPSVDSMIHSDDPASRFGVFPAADLSKVLDAVDKHIEHLAVLTQVPSHYLMGKAVNLSSDAIAAIETPYIRRVLTIREPIGEGYAQALRVGAAIVGLDDAAHNMTSKIHWNNLKIQALGASVDAVTKLHSTGMPRELSYSLIPEFTKKDIEFAANNPLD